MNNRPNESSGESSRNAKRSAIPFDQYPSPKIFKLHVLCCNEVFDYLSLKDLLSMGQTCVRFNKIVGKYFQENYPSAEFTCHSDHEIHYKGRGIGVCSEFIQHLKIKVVSLEQFRYIGTSCKSLKKIEICTNYEWKFEFIQRVFGISLTTEMIECIKEILPKLESIRLDDLNTHLIFAGDIYEDFLKKCINLKELDIHGGEVGSGWLHHHYPELQHVKYFNITGNQDEWNVFFDLNPQIQTFDVTLFVLLNNRDLFLTSNMILKRLTVSFVFPDSQDSWEAQIDALNLLNRLHERRFYEKLQIRILNKYIWGRPHQVPQFRDLDKLQILAMGELKRLPIWSDVKELTIGTTDVPAKSFPNVERLVLNEPILARMLPFITNSTNLKEIYITPHDSIEHYLPEFVDEYKSLDMLQWNIEREKLDGANKVTIYVEEDIYNLNCSQTNFSLIKIKKIR